MVRTRFIVFFVATILIAVGARAAYAGSTTEQRGSWDGRSESMSAVVIDGDRTYGAEIPDGSNRVPDVVAPSFPTAYECGKGVSAGVGIAGFGGTAGGVVESEECNARADAAYAAKLGDHVTAREIMCAKERYYLGNKRSQEIYARAGKQYVDAKGFPMACFPNEDFEKTYKDQEGARQRRANDAHAGAIPNWYND